VTVKAGKLFVISGASGSGKTTLCRALESELGLNFSVSATTRPQRVGETEGHDYYFLSDEKFDKMVSEGDFLEWANVHGYRYGTPRKPIENSLKKGISVLLDIDTQGALHLKERNRDAVLVFIMPPDERELRKRLELRGTDSPEVIERRIEKAKEEIAQRSRYDHVILNKDLETAKNELRNIITREGAVG